MIFKYLKNPWLFICIALMLAATFIVLFLQSVFLKQPSLLWGAAATFLVGIFSVAVQSHIRKLLHKESEEKIGALAKAYAFQQSVLDGVADPIMVIGTDYLVKMMNRSAQEFYSVRVHEPEKSFCFEISHKCKSPCNGKAHPCPLEKVRQSSKAVTMIHRHDKVDGTQRILEVVAAPLWDANGAFQGIIESMHDVTDRTRNEQVLQKYTDRLRSMATQLAEVEDAERQRLSQELHDQVGQNLTAIGINLSIIKSQLTDKADEPVNLRIDDSLVLLDQTAERIRDVMAELRPPVLDDYGLVAALRWYGKRFSWRAGIDILVDGVEPDPRLAARVENALFRIAQEAFNNVAKHAQATKINVKVDTDDKTFRLSIIDNGIGFDLSQLADSNGSPSWGLLTMTERADAVGGRCSIESSPKTGTLILVEVDR